MQDPEEVREIDSGEQQLREVPHILDQFVAKYVLEMTETEPMWTLRTLWAHLLDRSPLIFWVEGVIHFPVGALGGCRGVLRSAENLGLVFGRVLCTPCGETFDVDWDTRAKIVPSRAFSAGLRP